jgi:GNAT superfamily N-acetyltransferase
MGLTDDATTLYGQLVPLVTMTYTTRPLDPITWEAFEELVVRNSGVFGGCWCMGGYPEGLSRTDPGVNRANKYRRVHEGAAHSALVFDEQGRAQGWCQYGDAEELARVKYRRAYEADAPSPPDWRIQCFYVDPRHRGQGIARVALEGALEQIAERGGGLVEAISEVTTGRQAHGRFLFSANVELFEQYGFARGRQLGKNAYLVSRFVEPPTAN